MSTTSAEAAAQFLYQPNVQYNASRTYTIKFLAACFAGAVAGILGLENWLGFALFIFSTALTSACLYIKCKGRPAKYMPGGLWELVNPGQENMSSFLLVWTLFYGASAPLMHPRSLTHFVSPQASYMVRDHGPVLFAKVLILVISCSVRLAKDLKPIQITNRARTRCT